MLTPERLSRSNSNRKFAIDPLFMVNISRPSHLALFVLGVLLLLFSLTLADAAWRGRTVDHTADRALVRELGLSDLSLLTEARYTRHPSQADRHAAFQDHPAALEHFPTGSLLPPPVNLNALPRH